jgi:hypothetical protein
MSETAIKFLKEHGDRSLISLGCGNLLNRLDNHVRLFVRCGVEYYVGIDRVAKIEFNPTSAFSDLESARNLLSSHYNGEPDQFFDRVKTFPNTHVEELTDIQCKVVVCQRILPFRHWEHIIKSMNPLLILQEDLKGCELQTISGEFYKRTFPGIIHYQLQPFRPNRFIPVERNIILWRRRDFFPCQVDMKPWWERFLFRFAPSRKRMHHHDV